MPRPDDREREPEPVGATFTSRQPGKRDPIPGHRALRKGRASVENAAYCVTSCAESRRPVFASSEAAEILIGGIRWLRETGRIWILGYVIMPDHVHLLFALRAGASLPTVMQAWKSFTARDLCRGCGALAPVWQRGYYDHMIRDTKDLWVRLDYMHHNPVRKHLVETAQEYRFSTAHPSCAGDVDAWWMV